MLWKGQLLKTEEDIGAPWTVNKAISPLLGCSPLILVKTRK